ncbi:hypothetical protein FKW77_003714 [Venturia effusa]|uniref:Dockerin type 1 n=1 Tax=Venturia effusa TaxID=50376 RepID=A0A517LGX0_9PEZI|nr:hypothetical protein FKW77_003714 [Venturia effusa]
MFASHYIILLLYVAVRILAQTPPISSGPYVPNASVGGGGSQFKDSPHFRIHGVSDGQADVAIKHLEAAYACFVSDMGWRSHGLSYNKGTDSGPKYKENIYAVATLGSAAGQMFSDARTGYSYVKTIKSGVSDPKVVVHEYGHALTYHERGWVDQKRTGVWWETVANFFADTYMTSPLCAKARAQFGNPEGRTIIELNKIIGSSHQTLVDGSTGSGNYYQAWPFLSYLTHNPDKWEGLGRTVMPEMFRKYKKGSNETPFHALERVIAPMKVSKVVGRYWARMAYVDIGHAQAQKRFMEMRGRLNYANLDQAGGGNYKVKSLRSPKYMGASIIPLKGTGAISVSIKAGGPFTATLAVRAQGGAVKYVDIQGGKGGTTLASGEEATLVVANTPDTLLMYDGFKVAGTEVTKGLDFTLQITGATA